MRDPASGTGGSPRLTEQRASDAMRAGVITCPPTTPLGVVARMMSSYRVHCVVVTEPADEADSAEQPWRVISDRDLVGAAGADLAERSAGSFASGDALTVAADDTLERVARLMAESGTAHVVVRDSRDRPLGVVSTLDIIDVLAAGG